jgi:heptosyltransferase-2
VLAYHPQFRRLIHIRRLWLSWRFARQELWPGRPNIALLPRWDVDLAGAAFVAYFSGAAGRAGWSEQLSERHRQENRGYDRLLTTALTDWTGTQHEVASNLELLRRLGGTVKDERLELWLDSGDEAWAKTFLDRLDNGPGTRWVALGLGSRMPRKNWPLERYVELAAGLQRDQGFRTLAVLGPGEEPLAVQWRQATGNGTVALGQSLRQTAALLKRCALFVGNDSGPKHLAAAMGIPVVEVNASPVDADPLHPNTTSAVRFGPWGVQSRTVGPQALQAPCRGACTADTAHCILGVRVEDVATAIAVLTKEQGTLERRDHL